MEPSTVAAIEVGGVRYVSAERVVEEIGVSRTTLWRWRRTGKVPAGRRYRDRLILFTPAETQAIRDYANRLEPASSSRAHALARSVKE